MAKQLIKLTESDLRHIITNTVNQLLKEGWRDLSCKGVSLDEVMERYNSYHENEIKIAQSKLQRTKEFCDYILEHWKTCNEKIQSLGLNIVDSSASFYDGNGMDITYTISVDEPWNEEMIDDFNEEYLCPLDDGQVNLSFRLQNGSTPNTLTIYGDVDIIDTNDIDIDMVRMK